MHICHVTPHLPPDQAANALLPYHLGAWSRESGDKCSFVAHPSRQSRESSHLGARVDLAGPVAWVPLPRSRRSLPPVMARFGSVAASFRVARLAGPFIAGADVVHVHSNGLLPEVAAFLAARRRKPVVLTMYGTEIWHYRPRRAPDLFTRAYRRAAHVTFYSEGLRSHAASAGLGRDGTSVIYPPVAAEFREADQARRRLARRALGFDDGTPLLVNVKRLHPLGGQRHLIEALPAVRACVPGTQLVICGTGPLREELEAVARKAKVEEAVRFTGLVDNSAVALHDQAADVFVLPSLLEACPTVALEALACGTPVVSTDNPGGIELARLFGRDVAVVAREDPVALARAITAALQERRRADGATIERIEREFRLRAVAARFRAVYESVIGP
ncbi:MAG: glycosyltransferase family 4 protein [Vicinamibacterales bacterium]